MKGAKGMEKEKRKIIATYRPTAYYRKISKAGVFGCAAVMGGIAIIGSIDAMYRAVPLPVEICAVFLIGILYSYIAWRFYFHAFVDKILVTSEGLAIEGWHQAFAEWSILSHVDSQSDGRGAIWGIYLAKKLSNPKSRGWFGYDFANTFIPLTHIYRIPMRFRLIGFRREIDLDKFAQTPLGQDLLYYAPHLFDEAKDKRETKAEPDWLSSLSEPTEASYYVGSDSNQRKDKR